MHAIRTLTAIAMTLLLPAAASAAPQIERIEPPSWWTGFVESELQLLVYGSQVAQLTPAVDYDGVTISRVERTDNPNYLFVCLDVSAATRPGVMQIEFAGNQAALNARYDLAAKNSAPGHVKGYGPANVIDLITPDRFANGDPGNDRIDGMGDPPDRAAR